MNPTSFTHSQYTSDGGTHLSAFRESLLKRVNEYAKGKSEGDDVRKAWSARWQPSRGNRE